LQMRFFSIVFSENIFIGTIWFILHYLNLVNTSVKT
jgi:hypothetical protein